MIAQRELWWADFGDPVGAAPSFTRPVAIIQCDPVNASRIETIIVVPVTSNLKLAKAPGNVLLTAATTGLDRDSVANVSAVSAIDRSLLLERAGRITEAQLARIFSGIDLMLGR